MQTVTRKSKTTLRQGRLVLYKHDPARVASVGRKKLHIELADGDTLSVRPKDVTLLHPGPLASLDDLRPQEGEVRTAWELLSGRATTLAELAELAYGAFTPSTAWAAWQWVADGLRFEGTPGEVIARSPEAVAEEQAAREARAAERRAWEAFLERARAGRVAPQDDRYVEDVERLALGETDESRVLRELGRLESPESAHALLLELGAWDRTVVPYPRRLDVPTGAPAIPLPDLPEEPRVDLTHLPAFAIDDEDSHDPDDAVGLEVSPGRRRLWVHIADVAALVPPDSEADLEARARGATLYLPDGNAPMLPPQAVQTLGMGLADVSPALSFGLDMDGEGRVAGMEVVSSWVRVTRLTYREVEDRLEEEPFRELYRLAQAYQARRRANGAVRIDLPEVKIRVEEEGFPPGGGYGGGAPNIVIRPLPPLRSRGLVREAMLMTGEATARFALERGIPFPFATQDPPDTDERPEDLAGMYALRRSLRPSRRSGSPGPHAGLGLELYARATSPLRRYLDLVVHQQLRAHIRGEAPLEAQEVMERIGAAEAVVGGLRRTERLSRRHWTLVYLAQRPDWQGEGVVVEKRDRRATVLVPQLALEARMHPRQDLPLNAKVSLVLMGVDLAGLEAHFQIRD